MTSPREIICQWFFLQKCAILKREKIFWKFVQERHTPSICPRLLLEWKTEIFNQVKGRQIYKVQVRTWNSNTDDDQRTRAHKGKDKEDIVIRRIYKGTPGKVFASTSDQTRRKEEERAEEETCVFSRGAQTVKLVSVHLPSNHLKSTIGLKDLWNA